MSAASAAKDRRYAAERLAVAAYDEHFGIDVGLRRIFHPVLHTDHDFDRLLGRIEQIKEGDK